MTDFKVYVACLAAYNNGRMHGAWVDVTEDENEFNEAIQAMLKDSPESDAEEWAFHDYDAPASSLLGEYSSIAEVCKLAGVVATHDVEVVEAAETIAFDVDELECAIERYEGVEKNKGDWAYERAESCGDLEDIPDMYRNAIDWDSVASGYENDGYHFVQTGFEKCHVFAP